MKKLIFGIMMSASIGVLPAQNSGSLADLVILGMKEQMIGGDSYHLYEDASIMLPRSPMDYRYRGLARLAMGKYREAIADLDVAIKNYPDWAELYVDRGTAKLKYGIDCFDEKFEVCHSALIDFDKAVRLSPNNDYILHSRAKANYRMGDYCAAVTDDTRALELNPGNNSALYIRARSYYAMGDYHDAIQDFTRLLKNYPQKDSVYYFRGMAKRHLGEHKAALYNFQMAISVNEYFTEAIRMRGIIRKEEQDYQGALQDFNRVLHLDPGLIGVYKERGLVWIALDKRSQGCEDLQKASDLGDEEAIKWLGSYCY